MIILNTLDTRLCHGGLGWCLHEGKCVAMMGGAGHWAGSPRTQNVQAKHIVTPITDLKILSTVHCYRHRTVKRPFIQFIAWRHDIIKHD